MSFQLNTNRKQLWQNAGPRIISIKCKRCKSVKLLNAEAASGISKIKRTEGQGFSPKWEDFFFHFKPNSPLWF